MKDDLTRGWVVNGKRLTVGQMMTLRAAVGRFWEEMENPEAMGADEFGVTMAAAYRARAEEILHLMMESKDEDQVRND